jgi:hypothetical protein
MPPPRPPAEAPDEPGGTGRSNWDLLRAGDAVKMRYSVDGGRNFATHVQVRP